MTESQKQPIHSPGKRRYLPGPNPDQLTRTDFDKEIVEIEEVERAAAENLKGTIGEETQLATDQIRSRIGRALGGMYGH